MKMSKKTKVVLYVILTLIAVYFLFPFVYMFFSTFKSEAEAVAYPPSFLPDIWNWQNYVDAWNAQPFGTFLKNSVIVTVGSALGSHGIRSACCIWICKIPVQREKHPLHAVAFHNDDSVGRYNDPAVYGI